MSASHTLTAILALINFGYMLRWLAFERARTRSGARAPSVRPGVADLVTGFGTNFLDTLGIGSFAPTTATFKFRRNVSDENIPGTLNVGQALPTATQGMIFIALVSVDPLTLVGMIASAAVGSWLGARIVSRLSRRAVQIGMGIALLVAALIFLGTNLHLLPGGGSALGLQGATLAFACLANCVLGALMSLGIGLYAPCLILLCLLGMNPIAAFPIMMGSCACLMPIGALQFIRRSRYDLKAALGLALGGIPAVLVAAFAVKSLPIDWLRWLVVVVVMYAAVLMLQSAARSPRQSLRQS